MTPEATAIVEPGVLAIHVIALAEEYRLTNCTSRAMGD